MRSVDIENGAYTVYEDGTVISHRRAVLGVRMWIVDPAYSHPMARSHYGHYHHYKLCSNNKHRLVQAHRLVWESFNGPVPVGLIIRHLDDNPSNNALSNLAVGTHKDNAADSKRNGHDLSGERHNMAKLTEEDVVAIRVRCRAGESQVALAKEYGVRQGTISAIVRGKLWPDAGGPISAPRDRYGEGSALAVLTAAQVAEIRATTRTTSDRALASRLGVCRSTVSGIRSGKSWKGQRKSTPRVLTACRSTKAGACEKPVQYKGVGIRLNLLLSAPAPATNRINLLTGSFPTERWLSIAGWPGYEVSSFGRVRSFKHRVPLLVKQQMSSNGYKTIGVSNSAAQQKTLMTHRLVCEAFHGQPSPGLVARHLNGDKLDNRAVNMGWGTYPENVRDMFRHGRGQINETHWNARLSDQQVADIRDKAAHGAAYKELSDEYGISYGYAREIVLGEKRVVGVTHAR